MQLPDRVAPARGGDHFRSEIIEPQDLNDAITRRRALRDLAVAGIGAATLAGGVEDLIARAAASSPRRGSLKDIEHVVILMQENRSFDHYFGTLSGVRGFGDKHGRKAFSQPAGAGTTIRPWHLPTGCLPDITARMTSAM